MVPRAGESWHYSVWRERPKVFVASVEHSTRIEQRKATITDFPAPAGPDLFSLYAPSALWTYPTKISLASGKLGRNSSAMIASVACTPSTTKALLKRSDFLTQLPLW